MSSQAIAAMSRALKSDPNSMDVLLSLVSGSYRALHGLEFVKT